MSLIYCPECGHEISNSAVACPNCGRPINARPVVERKVVVAPTPVRETDGFPTWAFIPIASLGLILLAFVFFMLRGPDDASNANIRVTANTRSNEISQIPARTEVMPEDVRTSPDIVHTTTVPGTTSSAPSAPPDKGSVAITASIATPTGTSQAAKSVRFYLLDQDLETILSDARIDPIEGNTLSGSLGLAMVYPDRFGDFQRKAMRAIASHTKYSGTTDARGLANIVSVEPKDYYLFSITRMGHGFAMWDSPVSVVPGQNVMNLSPQSVTEIPDTNGE